MKQLLGAAACALILAGCGGSGGASSVPGFGNNNGFIRFVNG